MSDGVLSSVDVKAELSNRRHNQTRCCVAFVFLPDGCRDVAWLVNKKVGIDSELRLTLLLYTRLSYRKEIASH